ncbi:hypothetical protein ABIB25_000505 [Nakamurella sp. UYEF19]|uniref:hypothetical protein n=1 Tax=Nakamurella sp. UYEF19 TaxID=1756392 RepID=UPI0033967E65
MKTRITVAVLTFALVVYFWLLGQRGFYLLETGTVVGISLGIGVLILPVIGVVLVVFELRFGAATARLARRLAQDDELPDDEGLTRRPSGRIERASADAYFETVRTRVEADEGNWRLWYELGYAYNLAGDRKRARAAMRTAIELAGR